MHTESELCQQWMSLADEEITADLVKEILFPIKDDLWTAAASADRALDNLEAQRLLLETGLERTRKAADRITEALNSDDSSSSESEGRHERLLAYFSEQSTDAKLCQIRTLLLSHLDLLRTYEEIQASYPEAKNDAMEDGWEDDPWRDADGEGKADSATARRQPSSLPPLSLFISEKPLQIALLLASQTQFGPLHILRDRHWSSIFPHRYEILDQIPSFANSTLYRDLLPLMDAQSEMEVPLTESPWRPNKDIVEEEEVQEALAQSEHAIFPSDNKNEMDGTSGCPNLLNSDQVFAWFKRRAESIYSSSGMVDVSLGLVQHGVSRGVLGLDALGEDLSLLSRLIYDRPNPELGEENNQLTLSEWHTLEPDGIIRQYLDHSSPSTVVADIRRLVLPYLFVLESRAERAGQPDAGLVNRLLYEYVLDADLKIVAAIFEASKPTMIASQRIVTNDEDMARLALACLYGSSELKSWTIMSRIFECLPAWNFASDEDGDEADTTVASLSAFLAPSTSRPRAKASNLLLFFKPLPARSLSRTLDVLDVHLESGEILARWGVPVPILWFLQSAHDEAQQRAWAMRMARQADAPQGDLDSEDVWLSLLEDMLKLGRPEGNSTYSAFGALSPDEIRQIFFRGILSTGSKLFSLTGALI